MRRKNKGEEVQEQAAEYLDLIREVYRINNVPRATRRNLSVSINRAAREAGVSQSLTHPEKYEQAERKLRGDEGYGAILAVHFVCDDIRKIWERPAGVKSTEAVPRPVRRLGRKYYDTAESLEYMLVLVSPEKYAPLHEYYRVTKDAERRRLEKDLRGLCDALRIDHHVISFREAYITCLKRLGGQPRDPRAARIQALAEEIERRVIAREQGDDKADGRKTRKSKPEVRRIRLVYDNCQCVGFIGGEIVEATEAHDLRAWDIVALRQSDKNTFIVGRAVAVTTDTITVRNDCGEGTHERRTLTFEGRVSPEPVGKVDPLTSEARGRVEILQEKIEALGREDDQILRCTARYKYEKEIFDLEHPVVDNPDDWSAWEDPDDAPTPVEEGGAR